MEPVASARLGAGRSGAVASPAGVEVSVVIRDTMATGRESLKCCGHEGIAIVIQPDATLGRDHAARIGGHENAPSAR
jgi:hypothetical protein